jgi:hypothetical protein
MDAIFIIDLQDANKKIMFYVFTFGSYIYIIFQRKKVKRGHKTVEINGFLTITFSY